jgi:LEA14-like dessication related protein
MQGETAMKRNAQANRRTALVAVLALAAALWSFRPATAEERPPKDYSELKLTVQTIRVDSISYPKVALTVTTDVENPNSKATLSNLKYRIKLNGVESGEGRYEGKTAIPGKGKATFDFPVSLDVTAVPDVVGGMLTSARLTESPKIDYVVATEFDVSILFFKKHVKRTLTGQLPLAATAARLTPTLPELRAPEGMRLELPNIFKDKN